MDVEYEQLRSVLDIIITENEFDNIPHLTTDICLWNNFKSYMTSPLQFYSEEFALQKFRMTPGGKTL